MVQNPQNKIRHNMEAESVSAEKEQLIADMIRIPVVMDTNQLKNDRINFINDLLKFPASFSELLHTGVK